MLRKSGATALLLSLALIASCSKREEHADPQTTTAPVIVISIDTLRADRLPAYGYKGVKTPAFDAFRRDAILYRNAWSHVPMTLPSHASLLTGLLPTEHGVRNNLGYTFDGNAHPTIARSLKSAGYATAAAVSAYVLRGSTGIGAEFDVYEDAIAARADASVGELSRDGNVTAQIASRWIADNAQRPFFYFLHLFEPHTPYTPPEPFATLYASNRYDGEIAAADAILGQFLESLKTSGVYDRALIIVLSDHGEGLGDHGESEHGVFLYREAIQVPLLVKLPGNERAGSEVTANVQLIDVAPTIAAVTGVKLPDGLRGTSILGEVPTDRVIYSETFLPKFHFGWSDLQSAVRGMHHHIRAPRPELYDLSTDPTEKVNVLEEQRRVYASLRQELDRLATTAQAPAAVSGEEAEKLAALGYIGSMRESEEGGPLPDPKDRIGDLERMREASQAESEGRGLDAQRIYETLLAENPRFTDAWARLAALLERNGDPARAEEAYKRAIATAPSLAPGFALSLGDLQWRMRKFDDAAAHANLALTRPSAAAGAHLLLARIAISRGDFATADREARLAVTDASRRREAAVIGAQVRTAQGRFAEALQILDGVKREAGEPVPDLESSRGDALARMNRVEEAERAFRAELATFPRNREAYTRLAILLVAMNRANEAERVLEEMFAKNRSRATANLAAETWRVVENEAAARRWAARAASVK